MPSLKDYRDRIASVKSTRKITSAMKMVAASKLKKAQSQAEASQPYATAMAEMLARVAASLPADFAGPKMLVGTGADKTHLLIVVSSDRGLCGGFNGNLARRTRKEILALKEAGKDVKIICAGRKVFDILKLEFAKDIIKTYTGIGQKGRIDFSSAREITDFVLNQFEDGAFDVCTLMYNEFKNVLTQTPSAQQLIPFKMPETASDEAESKAAEVGPVAPYGFEPEESVILGQLLPRNLGVQLFRALLDSAAGEQAARMTAMDNATRNAGDMINDLSIQYNRARQAFITKELIEIISGAEAV
ncbi:MAG: F0F1 ATP synthase subunit gamma [Pseudomonadota bacterium]|jgi:F-type H+-transporting ATPase subunit gamma|nr:F0F1 ATP synthase subunit gamma [Pseudomonadota bacterium]MEC9234960.1 F0F1 ATP synthase subunit gamma [Pseudomonadota bacterium]MED5423286.1 F0F1 ATP synthase subunit gamma [Pseudomonadota bacterium]